MNEGDAGLRDGEFWPGDTIAFGRDECFLCGAALTSSNRSNEHVFGQWLLDEFHLRGQTISLLNGTLIPYRHLRIPCCRQCNTGPLSRLEHRVAAAYRGGFEAFLELDRRTLFLWLAKIVYGILVREVHLPEDRRDPSSGTILTGDDLSVFGVHHFLLQAILDQVTWDQFPGSILLFRTQTGSDPRANFDFTDAPFGPFLSLRIGPIGIIAVLQDWGSLETLGLQKFEAARQLELAPLQFREISALARYFASNFKPTPKLVIGRTPGRPATVTCLPLAGVLGGPLYHPFDPAEYAPLYAFYLSVPIEAINVGEGLVTFLSDDLGAPRPIPFESEAASTAGRRVAR